MTMAVIEKQDAQMSGFLTLLLPQTPPQGAGLRMHWQLPLLHTSPGSEALHCSAHTHDSASRRMGSQSGPSACLLLAVPSTSTGLAEGQPHVPSRQCRAPGQAASAPQDGKVKDALPSGAALEFRESAAAAACRSEPP